MPVLLGLVIFVLLLILTGVLYQYAGATADARRYPSPGVMIDIGTGSLNAVILGAGSPVVVFEAGIASTTLSWQLVQPEIGTFSQTVSYDRAWLGWSDPLPEPRHIWTQVEELRRMLARAALGSPRVLVAHSYGGLIAQAYALRYPQELAGMVLVDPAAAAQWTKPSKTLRLGVSLSRRGAFLARIGLVRFALNRLTSGSRTLPKLIARASSGQGGGLIERLVGQVQKLPREVWPLIQSRWCDPKCFEGMARYLEALPENAASVPASPLGDLPLIVLSSETASAIERQEHEELARRSTRGRLEIVSGSGHWIQLDRPDVVIQAIRELFTFMHVHTRPS
ncbi:MAG: alpha/beta hydrolase [Bryobacteraceae bacterium]